LFEINEKKIKENEAEIKEIDDKIDRISGKKTISYYK
jgi:hypothetical protein